jgi:hypothetical protein
MLAVEGRAIGLTTCGAAAFGHDARDIHHAVDTARITPALPIARHALVSTVPIPAIPLFTCFPSLPADILLAPPAS